MLNDSVTSSSSSAGPAAADDDVDADNHKPVDCTHIPRLTGHLYYVRFESLSGLLCILYNQLL